MNTWIGEDVPSATQLQGLNLMVSHDAGAQRWTLIQFDLSFIPANSTVKDATLYLFERDALSPGFQNILILKIASAWDQRFVTWNTKPGYNPTPVWATFDPSVNCMRAIRVGALVQEWVNVPDSNHGLMLQSTGTSGLIRFASTRETNNALWPRLMVEFTAPTPTPTRTPTNTPTVTPSATVTPLPTPQIPDFDINGDGKVDYSDLVLFGRAWYTVSSDPRYDARADFDFNGAVEFADLNLFKPHVKPAEGFNGTMGGQNGGAEVCLTGPDTHICPTALNLSLGSSLPIPLRAFPGEHVYGMNVRFTYDSTLLSLTDVLPGYLPNQPIAAGMPTPSTTVLIWDTLTRTATTREFRIAALALTPQGSFKAGAINISAPNENAFRLNASTLLLGLSNIQFQEAVLTDENLNSNAVGGNNALFTIVGKPQP